MCDMRERRCSLLDLGHGDVRYAGAAMLFAACTWARRCAIRRSGDAPCCLNMGTAMCDMQERRCSLLDLGHGNVQYAAMSLAGWRPNYSHTSFVNSVPNPQARWSNGWQRGHCAEAHRGTSGLWLIPQSADCRASLHVRFISEPFAFRLVCPHHPQSYASSWAVPDC